MADTAFICGVPRSGTTILANIVDSHESAIALIEPHLNRDFNGSYMHESIGGGIKKDPRELFSELNGYNILSFKETYRNPYQGMNNASEISEYLSWTDTEMFIVRDVRGVLGSQKNVDWGPNSAKMVAKNWNNFVSVIRERELNYIRYEDLVLNTEQTKKQIFDCLGLELYEGYTLHKRNSDQPGDNKANESLGVIERSLTKWRDRITEEEEEALIGSCKRNMVDLGYIAE